MRTKARILRLHKVILLVALIGALALLTLSTMYFFRKKYPQPTHSAQQPNSQTSSLPTPLLNDNTTPAPSIIASTPPSPIPTVVKLSNGSHTFQTFNNCGPASLSMALSYFEITVSQHTLGAELRPYQHPTGDNDDKSVTLAELAEKAKEYGLLTYHRPAGSRELLEQLVAAGLPVITRTWLQEGEDIGHFRVITGYDKTKGVLIQDDSLQGKNLEYTYAVFDELWRAFNYEFLVLAPSEKQSQVLSILGELSDEETAWQRALILSETQLSSDPDDIYAQFNQAVALYHLNKYEQAVTVYEKVSTQLPARMLWYQLEPLLAYYQLGRYEKVLTLSQSVIDNNNRAYSELYWLRGQVFQKQGETEKATEAFTQAERYNTGTYWRQNVIEQ